MRLCFTLALLLALQPAARADTIWIEAEKPDSSSMNRHPWWYDKVNNDELSGNAWISNFHKDKPGAATYTFEAPAGAYNFWLRANPVASKLSYTLDNAPEKEVDFSSAVDRKNIAADAKPDLRFISWVHLGEIKLTAGKHTLSFRMHSANSNHGAIDCFLFTTENFTPDGPRRPGQQAAPVFVADEKNAWPFNPPLDKFTDDALLDLRSLNEKTAGEKGLIRLAPDGMSFLRGDGQPIRFWAVVADGAKTPEAVDQQMRFLAKKGVNMVRLHRQIANAKEGAAITDINEKELDSIFQYVAAARKHGIYLTISPFWAHLKAPKSWNLADYENAELWGVMFFNDDLQAAYRAWTKELYTRTNPYTNIPLKDDPAVAIIQVKNEDSLLFWTFQGIKPAQRKILSKKYGDWLVKKYGALDKALAAWNNATLKDDDLPNASPAFYMTWDMTQNASPKTARRMRDQTEFLAWIQHKFYADIHAHYRSLGCKQLVNAMNWRSADPVRLDDLERWTYTANEVLAINSYFTGMHVGANNGYRIDPGHHITDVSALKNPGKLLANLKQVVGHPMMLTEAAWVHPNLYQTEGPFLMTAYQSLTGVDVTYWFAINEKQWLTDPRRLFWKVGGSYALDKWSANVPQSVGMFPAFSIAFRNGYIQSADRPAVYEERRLDDLWERKIPIISEGGKFDPNRDAGAFAPESKIKQEVDRLAFLVGPVHLKFAGDPANNKLENLDQYIDRSTGVVTSLTGQIKFDTKRNVCTVSAPKFAGVCGFLKEAGGDFDLGPVKIRSTNDYATLALVSLDDQPLAQSRKILVQAGTTARLTGFATRPASIKPDKNNQPIQAQEITSTGKPPWQIQNTQATLTLTNPNLTQATLLDPNGYPQKQIPVKNQQGHLTLDLPQNTLYLILHQK